MNESNRTDSSHLVRCDASSATMECGFYLKNMYNQNRRSNGRTFTVFWHHHSHVCGTCWQTSHSALSCRVSGLRGSIYDQSCADPVWLPTQQQQTIKISRGMGGNSSG